MTPSSASQTSAPAAFDWDSIDWETRFNESECFSAENTVQMMNGEKRAINDLNIGDYVLTSSGYSRVYSLGHHSTEETSDFLQFFFNASETVLEITSGHLLSVKGALVRADSVKLGQIVGDRVVTAIDTIKRRGVFAPVTEQGDIYVSEVLASCFAAALPEHSGSFQHYAAQVLLSPRRLTCLMDFSICQNEKLVDGRPDFVWDIAKAIFTAQQQSAFMKILFGCFFGPIYVGATVLVWCLSHCLLSGILAVVFFGVLASVQSARGRKFKQL